MRPAQDQTNPPKSPPARPTLRAYMPLVLIVCLPAALHAIPQHIPYRHWILAAIIGACFFLALILDRKTRITPKEGLIVLATGAALMLAAYLLLGPDTLRSFTLLYNADDNGIAYICVILAGAALVYGVLALGWWLGRGVLRKLEWGGSGSGIGR